MTVRTYLGIFSIITSLIIGSPVFGMDDLNELLNTMNQNFKISQPKPSQRPLTPAEEKEFKAREDNLIKDIEALNAIQHGQNPISDKQDTPNPNNVEPPHTKKYLIIALAGISIPIAVGIGFGICKATPYIRKKIQEWKAKATTQVSANLVPVSIATGDQTPSLATIHQS